MTYFQLAMLPDPPPGAWNWQRCGYAAKHFAGQLFYRIRLTLGSKA